MVFSLLFIELEAVSTGPTLRDLFGERTVVTAPGPLLLEGGGRYSLEFGVEVGLAKYHWRLPLDRQRCIMAGRGLDVSTQMLFEQPVTIVWHIATRVVRQIAADIERSLLIVASDTAWMNIGAKDEKSKDRFSLWGVTNGRAIFYSVFYDRDRKAAKSGSAARAVRCSPIAARNA